MEAEILMKTLISTEESCLKHQTEGRYMEALQSAEKAYMLRCSIFGDQSQQAQNSRHTLVTAYNSVSIAEINKGNSALAKRLLKKAEKVCEDMVKEPRPEELSKCMKQQALTFNNLACLYRRDGDLRRALDYALDALELEDQHNISDNIASSFLNVCAILSQLNKHKEALKYAERALQILDGNIHAELATKGEESRQIIIAEKAAIMAIAYHNVGVEQEYLKMYAECLASYQLAYEIAARNMGEDHSITKSLRKSFGDAKKTLERSGPRRGSSRLSMTRDLGSTMNSASTGAPERPISSSRGPRSNSATPTTSARRSSGSLGGAPLVKLPTWQEQESQQELLPPAVKPKSARSSQKTLASPGTKSTSRASSCGPTQSSSSLTAQNDSFSQQPDDTLYIPPQQQHSAPVSDAKRPTSAAKGGSTLSRQNSASSRTSQQLAGGRLHSTGSASDVLSRKGSARASEAAAHPSSGPNKSTLSGVSKPPAAVDKRLAVENSTRVSETPSPRTATASLQSDDPDSKLKKMQHFDSIFRPIGATGPVDVRKHPGVPSDESLLNAIEADGASPIPKNDHETSIDSSIMSLQAVTNLDHATAHASHSSQPPAPKSVSDSAPNQKAEPTQHEPAPSQPVHETHTQPETQPNAAKAATPLESERTAPPPPVENHQPLSSEKTKVEQPDVQLKEATTDNKATQEKSVEVAQAEPEKQQKLEDKEIKAAESTQQPSQKKEDQSAEAKSEKKAEEAAPIPKVEDTPAKPKDHESAQQEKAVQKPIEGKSDAQAVKDIPSTVISVGPAADARTLQDILTPRMVQQPQ